MEGLFIISVGGLIFLWIGTYFFVQAWMMDKLSMWSDTAQMGVAFLIGTANFAGFFILMNLIGCGSYRCY